MIVKHLGKTDFKETFAHMKRAHKNLTQNQIWLCEHHPVYTVGRRDSEHNILQSLPFPLVPTDRGGHITFHGPRQIMAYILLDLKTYHLGIKKLVCFIETSLLQTLDFCGITAERKAGAPGIYVQGKKIASIGLCVRQFKSYHGLSLNYAMDLSPFSYINPCGFENLKMTNICEYNDQVSQKTVEEHLVKHLINNIQNGH